MSAPTLHSVQAHVKRAAKGQGWGFKATRTCGTVLVETLYRNDAERLGLASYDGPTSSWLRSVLTEEELLTIEVCVVVNNSDPMTDYFSYPTRRVVANWGHLVACDNVSNAWAHNFVYGEGSYDLERYGRGDLEFTSCEIKELAPSPDAARSLAVAELAFVHSGLMKLSGPAKAGNWAELVADRAATRDLIMSLDTAALELLLVMLPDWSLDIASLVNAVCVLIPQETPQVPALVVPAVLGEMPQALADYLGRLIHVPKKLYADRVYQALITDQQLPESDAVWADDVLKKVRRYARA